MKEWKWIWISVLIISVGLLGCGKDNPSDGGDPPPPPQEDPMKVGNDGGSVSNEEGSVTLAIPSGSLPSEVTFSIEETTTHPGDAVGKVYDIGPDGTQFDPSATLTLNYDEANLPSGAKASELVLATVENNSWSHLTTTVNEQDNTVSAEISHLSVYGVRWESPNIVGEEGGTVSSADSTVHLDIPENALFEETTFTFEETTTHPEGAIGKVYDIGPDGTQFELPVTLTFSYNETDLPEGTSESDLKIAVEEAGEWKHLTTSVNSDDNKLTAEISHLSVYGIVVSISSQLKLTLFAGTQGEEGINNPYHIQSEILAEEDGPDTPYEGFHLKDESPENFPAPLFADHAVPCELSGKEDKFATFVEEDTVSAETDFTYQNLDSKTVQFLFSAKNSAPSITHPYPEENGAQYLYTRSGSIDNPSFVDILLKMENTTDKSMVFQFDYNFDFTADVQGVKECNTCSNPSAGWWVRARAWKANIGFNSSTNKCYALPDTGYEVGEIIQPSVSATLDGETINGALSGQFTSSFLNGQVKEFYVWIRLEFISGALGYWKNDNTGGSAWVEWSGYINITANNE